MYFRVELHDDINPEQHENTLKWEIGQPGSNYPLEWVKEHILVEARVGGWRRAYILEQGFVKAVLELDDNGRLSCSARHIPHISLGWSLPFAGDIHAIVVNGFWGVHANTPESALDWATRQFANKKVTTTVLIHGGRVYCAWERIDGELTIVTRGQSYDIRR